MRIGVVLLFFSSLLGLACKKQSGSSIDSSPASEPEANSPALMKAKQKSRQKLEQIGLGMRNAMSALGSFPSAGMPAPTEVAPYGSHGWRVQILPFVEQQPLYNQINPPFKLPAGIRQQVLPLYSSPHGPASADTPYRVFVGNGAAFEHGRNLGVHQYGDGLSNTIFVVESAEPVNWADGPELLYDPKKPLPKLGIFPGGFHALMGDSSVIWLPSSTPEATIRAMITRAGGEVVLPP